MVKRFLKKLSESIFVPILSKCNFHFHFRSVLWFQTPFKMKFVYEQKNIKGTVLTVHMSYRIAFNFRHF
jgi:hypothetical protein